VPLSVAKTVRKMFADQSTRHGSSGWKPPSVIAFTLLLLLPWCTVRLFYAESSMCFFVEAFLFTGEPLGLASGTGVPSDLLTSEWVVERAVQGGTQGWKW